MGLIVRNVNFGGKLRGEFPQVPPPPSGIVTDGLMINLDAGNLEYNDGRNWAAGWSGSFGNGAAAFDGNLTTASGGVGGTFSGTYTFASGGLAVSGTIRVYVTMGASIGQVGSTTNIILINGVDISAKMKSAGVYLSANWIDVTTEVGSTFTTIVLNGSFGSTNPALYAVEVDGVILSNNIWPDLSGLGNNGTLTGSRSYTSGTPSYFTFSGGYVNAGTINLQRNFSAEIWCYITADNCGLFGQGTVQNNQGLHIMTSYFNGRGIVFGMYYNDLTVDYSSSAVFNKWIQLCFTYNHSTFQKQIYLNGQLIGSAIQSQYSGSGQFNVGATYSSAQQTMQGRIGNAMLYDTVLTSSQITQNFNALRGRYNI